MLFCHIRAWVPNILFVMLPRWSNFIALKLRQFHEIGGGSSEVAVAFFFAHWVQYAANQKVLKAMAVGKPIEALILREWILYIHVKLGLAKLILVS